MTRFVTETQHRHFAYTKLKGTFCAAITCRSTVRLYAVCRDVEMKQESQLSLTHRASVGARDFERLCVECN